MLIIFVMGYGISFYSLLYGTREFSWHIIRRVLNLSFWQIFGDLKVLEMFESSQSNRQSIHLKLFDRFTLFCR